MLHIQSVEYVTGYKIWVAFDDGAFGQVDLDGVLSCPVFEPLKDMAFFRELGGP